MHFLADENVHPIVVQRLRASGLDVEWVAEEAAGSLDVEILARPDIGALTMITYDRHFGDLIFNRGYPSPLVILYSRLGRAEPRHIADRILMLVDRGLAEHHLIAITRDKERLKPFPRGANNA